MLRLSSFKRPRRLRWARPVFVRRWVVVNSHSCPRLFSFLPITGAWSHALISCFLETHRQTHGFYCFSRLMVLGWGCVQLSAFELLLRVMPAESKVRLVRDTRGLKERSRLLQYFLSLFDLTIDSKRDRNVLFWLKTSDKIDIGHPTPERRDSTWLLARG